MMQPELFITKDGSHTLVLPHLQMAYHSHHGAVQESLHIYIQSGFHYAHQEKNALNIFEMGFGTGLNALLTAQEAIAHKIQVTYHCIEAFPLPDTIIAKLNHGSITGNPNAALLFEKIHAAAPGMETTIDEYFNFTIWETALEQWHPKTMYDVIYFDAFAPEIQPGLWSQSVFEKLFATTASGGCLLTYCSKSVVRKAMKAAGYRVTKIKGPWGKREIVRAIKTS